MTRSCALSLLLLASLAPCVWADVVHLRDGRVLEGEAEWTEAGDLRLRMAQGELVIPRADVREVIERTTPAEELAQRRAALDPQDVDGVLALGAWAREHGLADQARSLLLYAAALAPERAEVKAGLEALDFHFEDGSWIAPEVWYPAHGYVPWRGTWITADEAKLREAQRDRRKARGDLREFEQQARSAERDAAKAKEQLEAAERAVDTGCARVEHYQAEVKRILDLIEHARSEVQQASDRLVELEQERLVAVRTYDLWVRSPCACKPGQCACGWDRQRLYYLNACSLLDGQVNDARRALRRAEERLQAAESDLARGEALLAKSKQELARGEAAQARAEREWVAATARHETALAARDDAQLRLDDAQAPAPSPQPSESERRYPDRPLLSAAIQACQQPALDEAGRAAELDALERALAAGPQPMQTVLARFAHAVAGAPPVEVEAGVARLRGALRGDDLDAFERVLGALRGVDALAQVAAAQARHRAEHGRFAANLRDLFVTPGRFGPTAGYRLELVGDEGGWLAVATPAGDGLPYLARSAVGGVVASLTPIPLDLGAGLPRELEPLPALE